jgi:hypothetical protein
MSVLSLPQWVPTPSRAVDSGKITGPEQLKVQGSQLGEVPQNAFYHYDKAVVFGTARHDLKPYL